MMSKVSSNATKANETGIFSSRELIEAFEEETDENIEIPEEELEEEGELSYEEGLDDGMEMANSLEPTIAEVIVKQREDTRSTLAIIYIICTFLIFFAAMGIAVFDGVNREVSIIDNLSEVIPLFSGVFLGTLGFVLGYYFRKSDDDADR